MTFSDWLTFRFSTSVEMEGGLSPEEAESHLARLVAPPFSTAKAERRKPLRGSLGTSPQSVRWPLNEYRFVSARTLHFTIVPLGSGSRLVGEFRVWTAYRVIVMIWLYAGIAFNVVGMFMTPSHVPRHFSDIRMGVLATLVGFAMAYGYTGIMLAVGRGRDKDLVRLLQVTLNSAEQAEAARFLLSR